MPALIRPAKAMDPAAVLAQLTLEEKCALLSGDDMWHTFPVERLGVPRARVSDGPNGVRGTKWLGGAPASCFPAATAIGASFDSELTRRVGEALGEECRARGVHCLLGPTTNIQRSPLGGRGFESFGEDPYLSGTLGLAWIEGVQSKKVMTTPKHFVGNEQEYCRRSNNSVIDERTLHELYLEPFRIQSKGRPSGFMTSYNRVNGTHVAESPFLLRKILRQDFEFDGMIISDWSGTYSSSEAIKASLDLEMPGPAIMRGELLQRDITSGKLTIADIDECALRVLTFVSEAMESGIDFEAEEGTIDNTEVRSLLRESAAAGVVLLKNSSHALPLRPSSRTKIAVIGPNAVSTPISGGGSASLRPSYSISTLQGITSAAESLGASVTYSPGADTSRWTPLLTDFLRLPGGKASDKPMVKIDFYDQDPFAGASVKSLFTKLDESSQCYFIDTIPAYVPLRGWTALRASFIPNISGTWEFGLAIAGQADLYIDGKLVVENSNDQEPGILFFTTGTQERAGLLDVVAGQSYALEVRFTNFKQISLTSPYAGRRGGIRLGGHPKYAPAAQIEQAVDLSRASDITICVIGTNAEWESESYDRDDMQLPRDTNLLIEALLDANPDTIIINQSGMPVEFPWIDKCSTLVQAFFGGNEAGNAVADCLFGLVNPAGKLPITFMRQLEDSPAHANGNTFGHAIDTIYEEQLGIGYRYFDRETNPSSLFPFGYGLSYTTFAFGGLIVKAAPDFGVTVSFDITNTGALAGAEVAQVYIHKSVTRVYRPEMELKSFAKVFLQPEQSKRVRLDLDHTALSYYDVCTKSWVAEAGTYEIRVGSSSMRIALAAPFLLKEGYSWIGLQAPKKCTLF